MKDEREEAQYHQEHKDDQEEWGEPLAPTEAPRQNFPGAVITVRFSAKTAEMIHAIAEQSDMTYSDIVRRIVEDNLNLYPTIGRNQS